MTAPEAWAAAEARAFSACEHCDHHTWAGGELCCRCPELGAANAARPVRIFRVTHGGCGPDALHLRAPWLAAA